MLRTLFNKAARPPYLPEKPTVLVSTMGDDKTRGDSHGYIGLGKAMAAKLGGVYHYVDEDVLKTDYPDQNERDAFQLYFQDKGAPDIVFARNHSWQAPLSAHDPASRPFVIHDYNEDIASRFAGKDAMDEELVAHHLTSTSLRQEGQRFRSAHPDLKGSLIAVMVADYSSYGLAAALLPRLSSFPQATLFLCSSRRVSTPSYNDTLSSLHKAIFASGMQNRIHVTGYDFERGQKKNLYNPYIGLLSQADHIVICGTSQSIVSEALSTGKSVHLYQDFNRYDCLESKGYVSVFNAASGTVPLQTKTLAPLNQTEKIADRLIAKYRRAEQKKLGLFGRACAYMMDG